MSGLIGRVMSILATVFTMPTDVGADDFRKNEEIRKVLREHGDDGRKPRPIDHFAYFSTPIAVEQYRDFLSAQGYSINREAKAASQDRSWSIEFSKSQAPNDIDEETNRLRDMASTLGGRYDGWGTEVEKDK